MSEKYITYKDGVFVRSSGTNNFIARSNIDFFYNIRVDDDNGLHYDGEEIELPEDLEKDQGVYLSNEYRELYTAQEIISAISIEGCTIPTTNRSNFFCRLPQMQNGLIRAPNISFSLQEKSVTYIKSVSSTQVSENRFRLHIEKETKSFNDLFRTKSEFQQVDGNNIWLVCGVQFNPDQVVVPVVYYPRIEYSSTSNLFNGYFRLGSSLY